MSREIKFRAWNGRSMTNVGAGYSGNAISYGSKPVEWVDNKDHWPIMQFTGLKDSNGIGIYEGDILDAKYKAIISFKKGRYVVSNKNNKHIKGSLSEFLRIRIQGCDKCEVVGNIFES